MTSKDTKEAELSAYDSALDSFHSPKRRSWCGKKLLADRDI